MVFKRILAACLLLLSLHVLHAQVKDFVPAGNEKDAKGYFQYQNFRNALSEYLVLRSKDSTNVEFNHRIGLCYLYTNIDKTKAIPYLEWVVKQEKFDPNAWYDLGRAYQFAYRFEDARKSFKKFISTGIKDDNPISAKRQLEICDNADKLMSNPVNVTITNLGSPINTEYPEYNPFVPADESYIIFTSPRAGNLGGFVNYDGFFTADIYFAARANSEWKKGKGISNSINTYLVEEVVGLSPDGDMMFIYMDNEYGMSDIFVSEGKGRSFKRPESLGMNINQKTFESGACLTQNKKILIFASNREGTLGGMDLWMSQQLPTGEWGVPVNLGPGVNTIYDEDYPYFAPDGESFYFASTGYQNIGGYDIFKCKYNKTDNTFSPPTNIGYPINTPEDNTTISFTSSGRHAYLAAVMPGGYGQTDIYRVTFNNIEPKKCFISGIIMTEDSTSLFEKYGMQKSELEESRAKLDSIKGTLNSKSDTNEIEYISPGLQARVDFLEIQTAVLPQVVIRVTDSKTGQLQGLYRPNRNTGKYIIIVKPSTYNFAFECPGYNTVKKEYTFHDDESSVNNESEHIILTPLMNGN